MTGRRFMWKWAARTVRREWRQHVVILGLLVAGVTAALTLAVTAYNMQEPETKYIGNADFVLSSPDPEAADAALRRANVSFGSIQQSTIGRSGTTEEARVLVLDPSNETIGPLIALLDGRYPVEADEVAITDRAFTDGPSIGSEIDVGTTTVTVVGWVENPMSLSEEFVLASTLGSFELRTAPTTEFYFEGDERTIDAAGIPNASFSEVETVSRKTVGLIANVVGAFGMLEVALLVGSAFAVIAKRRERQFGLMAAAGAPPKLVRSAAMMTGVILGVIGALGGLALGLIGARVLVAALESTLDHRITFGAPVSVILPNVLLAIAVAAWASRRPAVKLSKQSVVRVLSATRPRPEPVGRAAVFGMVITGVGVALLVAGFARFNTTYAMGGVVLSPVGLLLLSPLLVKAIGAFAAHLPLEERLAGRAISRYNRRSAAVVAATALALAIPMGIAVVTEAIDARSGNQGPNLQADSVVLWAPNLKNSPHAQVPVDIDELSMTDARDAVGRAVPELTLTRIAVAFPDRYRERTINESGFGMAAPLLGFRVLTEECVFCSSDSYGFGGEETYLANRAWVASPELLAAFGLESDWLDTSVALVESREDLVGSDRGVVATSEALTVSRNWTEATAVPSVLLSPKFLEEGEQSYETVTIGWIGKADSALTAEQRTAVREAATSAVDVEFQRPAGGQSRLRGLGLLIGLIVGVGITISAVGLLAAEQSGDTALLASLGAQPSSGRRMSAAIAAFLAFSGALLGALIGYLPLMPMINSKADDFPLVVPFQFLFGLLVCFPLVAAATGSLMNRKAAKGTSLRESF